MFTNKISIGNNALCVNDVLVEFNEEKITESINKNSIKREHINREAMTLEELAAEKKQRSADLLAIGVDPVLEGIEIDEEDKLPDKQLERKEKGEGETVKKEKQKEAADIIINGIKMLSMEELRPDKFSRTDMGRAELFAVYHRPIAFYVPQAGCFYVYDGKIYKPDIGGGLIYNLYTDFYKQMSKYATTLPKNENGENAFQKSLYEWSKKSTIDKVLGLAQRIAYRSAEDFDKRYDIIVCQNGVYDLKLDAFCPHSPEYLTTKMARYIYNPEAKSEPFEKFVLEIMSGDLEKLEYLQKSQAAGIDGTLRLKASFIHYGPKTNNGKSTYTEVCAYGLGDYAATLSFNSLAKKKNVNASGPSPDIARMAGVLSAFTPEPDKSLTIDASLHKQLTGNDIVSARFLHKEFFEFRAVFTIYIDLNNFFRIDDMSLFTSGRINIIPFDREFKPEEQDKQLAEKLKADDVQSAIFNWLLEGWRKLKKDGLKPPQSVIDAVAEYARESDKIGLFISDCLAPAPGNKESSAKVFEVFRDWCQKNRYEAMGSTLFYRDLRTRGYKIEEGRVAGVKSTTSCVFDVRIDYT